MIVTLMTSSRPTLKKLKIPSLIAGATAVIFCLLPFHAFLTVWLSSLIGHYTALRLWKEVLLVVCALGMAYLIFADGKVRSYTLTRRLVWLILLYGLITAVWGVIALQHHAVTAKALGYGLIVNLRYLAFFLVTWAAALRTARLHGKWQRLVLGPAFIVVLFGLLQAFVGRELKAFGHVKFTVFKIFIIF